MFRCAAVCPAAPLTAWSILGPRVSFLVDMMEKMGCKMQPGFFSSVECEGQINGGFHLDEEGKPGVRGALLWLWLWL